MAGGGVAGGEPARNALFPSVSAAEAETAGSHPSGTAPEVSVLRSGRP